MVNRGPLTGRESVEKLFSQLCCLILFIGCYTGCGDTTKNRVETVFPEEKASVDDCGSEALSTRYFVHWQDGHVSVEEASSREDLIEKIVEPRLDEITFVEADRKIQLNDERPVGNLEANDEDDLTFWGQIAAEAPKAWALGHRGLGARVAVIDTGTDYNHPLLKNRIALNAGEEGLDAQGADKRSNGIDDDGNGYVDDWLGYHFYDPTNSDPSDLDFHGTHVAGIVAAEHPSDDCENPLLPRDNDRQCDPIRRTRSTSPMGVAPQADIVIAGFLSASGGTLSDAIKAIDYSVSRGAHIINASWGGASQCSLALFKAIKALEQKNVLFVAAAGNQGANIDLRPEYPASHRLASQLTVGSISISGISARHSNFGFKFVDLFAPGEFIVSTLPDRASGPLTGTSMATPFVSGALALLKGAYPEATAQQLKQAILSSVRTDVTYRNATRGRLDIEQALESLKDIRSSGLR